MFLITIYVFIFIEPSEVTNYQVVTASPTSVSVLFDDPEINGDCVDSFYYQVINLNETASSRISTYKKHQNSFEDLEACCTYQVNNIYLTLKLIL